jgi:two-component system, NarL family, nitrate/nitrite response regulator NarL
MSSPGFSITVVEPHLLLRECLISLISHYSFDLVRGVSSASELRDPSIPTDGRATLVILGSTYSPRDAIAESQLIHQIWPLSKTILLFGKLSPSEIQGILNSTIDACVPLFTSRDVFITILDLVAANDARIVMVVAPAHEFVPSVEQAPALVPVQTNGEGHIEALLEHHSPSTSVERSSHASSRKCQKGPQLSERERQILDGLVRGHANKLIARTCDITEATVKVHMKSILRKIQVSNRTQAAVWALENGSLQKTSLRD